MNSCFSATYVIKLCQLQDFNFPFFFSRLTLGVLDKVCLISGCKAPREWIFYKHILNIQVKLFIPILRNCLHSRVRILDLEGAYHEDHDHTHTVIPYSSNWVQRSTFHECCFLCKGPQNFKYFVPKVLHHVLSHLWKVFSREKWSSPQVCPTTHSIYTLMNFKMVQL